MKNAAQYPISFPYGATSAPYSSSHPHRGDDRACPIGTPVIINGITIGLTGATGKVTGPHLHIQESLNSYTNTRKPQNAFKPGTVVNIDPNGTQGDGSFGKFITIRNADGWDDSYCHLSQINVTKGQIIGGDMPITPTQVDKVIKMGLHRPSTEAELNNPEKQSNPGKLIDEVWASGGEQQYNDSQNPQPTNVKPYDGPPLFVEE